MILKRWIDKENRWEFWDEIERISHQRGFVETTGIESINILLVFRDEKKQPFEIWMESKEEIKSQVYILNDEGKTIERIN